MSNQTQHIAIYGKGGIGKSTTTSNIAAALAEAGHRVVQIGCDPKSDSTVTLRGGNYLPTVLDSTRDSGRVRLEDISAVGFKGVLCVEAGGPVPGVGCAGRGINAAITLLQDLHLFADFKRSCSRMALEANYHRLVRGFPIASIATSGLFATFSVGD